VQAGGAQLGAVPPQPRHHADHAALAGDGVAADGDPLVHQRGGGHPPALADLAEPVLVGDAHVGEEHLVELGLAGDLPQRPHLDAGRGHVADEVGHAAVLGHVRVGAGDQDRPARLVRHGRPHLLAVDDPVVAVAHGAGAERGQVRSGARLAEQLAPDLLARPQRAQEALLLLLGAVGQDRGRGHAEADAVAFGVVARRARRGELGVHDRLQGAGRAEPAQARRVVHPGQPGVEPGPQERQPFHTGRIVVGKEASDPFAQVVGVRRC